MTKWRMISKIVSKWYQKSVDTGDPLVRVLPAKSQTWRGDKTNRQFKDRKKLKTKKIPSNYYKRSQWSKSSIFMWSPIWSIKLLLINVYIIPTNANIIERINWILFMCDKSPPPDHLVAMASSSITFPPAFINFTFFLTSSRSGITNVATQVLSLLLSGPCTITMIQIFFLLCSLLNFTLY